MTVHVNYDKSKVLQALRYHFISRMEIKILLILVNVFAIFSAILMGFKLIKPMPFLVSSCMWLVLMITFWYLLPAIVYGRNTTFKEHVDVSFRDGDILLETNKGYANWAYKKFQYYLETPHFFHLYINDKSFFLLPKANCTGEADTISVREMLDNKIGKK
jgi:hypothetical protein